MHYHKKKNNRKLQELSILYFMLAPAQLSMNCSSATHNLIRYIIKYLKMWL